MSYLGKRRVILGQMSADNTSIPTSDFRMLGVAPAMLKILDQKGILVPTPIQNQTIPSALKGKDIVGIAQTGTGKTFAFGLPMLQELAASNKRGLIVLPTRELAYQVEEALRPYANAVGIRMAVFVGGSPMGLQIKAIKRNPRILIATPGRLNDHLERRTVTLKEVGVLVLDEADRMLDMGFKPQIDLILKHVPRERQTLLFSATMPQAIFTLAAREMQLPLRIEVAPAGTAAAKVEQELIIVNKEHKNTLLLSLLKENVGSVLVFSRTKHGAKKIKRSLNDAGHKAAEIHSNRSLVQRREALEGFKNGKYRVLVATDIAARGIDVSDISVVINYDLPDDPGDYVHRIGRTGRAGRSGIAISFAMPSQMRDVRNIEKLTSTSIRRRSVPSMPKVDLEYEAPKNSRSRRKPQRSNSGRRSSAPAFDHVPSEFKGSKQGSGRPPSRSKRPFNRHKKSDSSSSQSSSGYKGTRNSSPRSQRRPNKAGKSHRRRG
ncbi:MAG: DEAD/DEAH box helicase [Kiritimatiellales bacterium]|nr:DEAD/DEAH box helicase [Kiritimatiellales bacterium]